MNKTELVAIYANRMNMPVHTATTQIDGFLDLLRETLLSGESVRLSGFLSINIKEYDGRTMVSPLTGHALEVKQRKRLQFSVGKKFNSELNSETAAA